MSVKCFGKCILAIYAIFLFAGLTIHAQPPKNRGVVNKPKPADTPPQPRQTASTPPAAPQTTKKKTVVVLDFNDVSLTADSVKRPIGKQLAVLLTTEFAKRGSFAVISQRDKEIAEERVKTRKTGKDNNYAAQIGKELSANLVVFGDLIEYTIVTETSNKYIKKDVKHSAKVGFTITLVDINTNEVKDGVVIDYVATSKDTDYGIYNTNKPLTEDQRITMLTEASKEGVIQAVDRLNQLITAPLSAGNTAATTRPAEVSSSQNAAQPMEANNHASTTNTAAESEADGKKKKKGGILGTGLFGGKDKGEEKRNSTKTENPAAPTANPPASNAPRIAAIDGQDVYVKNLPAGTKVGTKLIAYQIGKVLKDDVTGEILKQEELTIAELEVVSVTESSFICKITSGSGLTSKALIKIVK